MKTANLDVLRDPSNGHFQVAPLTRSRVAPLGRSTTLHTVAEELKIPFTEAKPKSCLLWPLAVFEGEIGVLSIHDDVFDYGCNLRNKRNPREALSLCPSISKNIEMVFGFEFKNALREAANKGLHRTSIPLRGTLTSEP